jgi:Domain of unknown function (DUF4380)
VSTTTSTPTPSPNSNVASSLANVAAAPTMVPAGRDPVVERVVRRYNYAIEFGPYAVEVDPADGGRIAAFSLDGRSVILPRGESPEAYGSSFWPSPQSDWGWPPPAALDKWEWKLTVEGSALVLESRVDEKLGLSATQRIAADAPRGAVDIAFTLHNRGSAPRRVAPWQNTRVRPGGLTFYPGAEPTLPHSTLKLAPTDGVVWFAHDPATMKESGKSFGDGAEGWLAHVDGDLVFVKVFPEVPRAAQAPGEAEIELYADPGHTYVELEEQGPFRELGPGARTSWTVTWRLRRLPAAIVATVGNKDLLALARALSPPGERKARTVA